MSEKDQYMPPGQEIEEAKIFMNSCSEKDLVESWNRLAEEWDITSLISIHRSLCESGRINALVNTLNGGPAGVR